MPDLETNDQYRWQRTERVTVHDSPRRARYPSIIRAADGSLLVLFTQQTETQEQAGLGDLCLARSTDLGQTWSPPTVVFRGKSGEPRAVNTMTALSRGRIIAPFTELTGAGATSQVRLLSSDDNGASWQISEVDSVNLGLVWWAPCGKIIETPGQDHLVMPVYGAVSQSDLKATIHSCGLLRSTDGGKTWGDISWIARGRDQVLGAADVSRFSFEGLSVVPLADGQWLAMVTARRLNRAADGPTVIDEGPGAPQLLCRLWSSDAGRTWTKPDQLSPGAWPCLATAGEHAFCVRTLWAWWGEMHLLISRDGFATFFQEQRVRNMEHLRGMSNRPQEMPPVPTVPYLGNQWPFQHYGFPSVQLLDQDQLVVVYGRTQRGTSQIDGRGSPTLDIPYEEERIEAIFYRRELVQDLAAAPAVKPAPSRGRWVLSKRIIVEDVGPTAQMPNGNLVGKVRDKIRKSADGGRTWHEVAGAKLPERLGAFGVMRRGRWLAATVKENKQWGGDRGTSMGEVGGYPTFKLEGVSYDTHIVIHHSDDEGKTWKSSPPFQDPFKWCIPSVSHFIESPDGAVALPIFGCVTDEEMGSYSSSNGVMRSYDGGETWGEFSFAFRTQPPGPDDYQPEPRYSEMDMIQLRNGNWVAFTRNERIAMGPDGWGTADVALSTDFGRTWKKTGGSLVGVSQQQGVVLGDGAIAFTYRSHSWAGAGVAISYDEGRSFQYALAGPYDTINAFAHGDDEFVIFTCKSDRSDMSAAVYRWVPTDP